MDTLPHTIRLTPTPWHGMCTAGRCERFANAAHEMRQPASSLALLLSVLERRTSDPALVPTVRAAQGAIERLSMMLPTTPEPCPYEPERFAAETDDSDEGAQTELWPAVAPTELADAGGAAQARGSVLLVEDRADVAEALATLLEDAGHCVRVAGASDEAVAVLGAEPSIVAVVSDFGLPGSYNGLEVLHFARERFPHAALVLITGDATPELLRATACSGMRLLHKPPNAAELLAALRI